VSRYLVVGGAGTLEVRPGFRLMDTPDFPEAYKAEVQGGAAFLDLLRQEPDLDWTFLSPSAQFAPGQRTGEFRLGKNELLSTERGSAISYEDYAVALVDEIERPAHPRQRFTVGY
jgi:putative NADH-flavin reductase